MGEVLRVWKILPVADMGEIAVSYFVNYVLISAGLYKLEYLYSLMVYTTSLNIIIGCTHYDDVFTNF